MNNEVVKKLDIKELRKICQESKEGWIHRNWFDKNVTRKISIYITYLMIKLKLTPNQITFLTLIIGIVGGIFIATGDEIYWLLGFLLLYFSVILDAVDGELARFYNKVSELGRYLDLFVGYILHKYILLTISIGIYVQSNEILALILGTLCIIFTSLSAENNLYKWMITYEYLAKSNITLNLAKSKHKSSTNLFINKSLLNKLEEHVFRSIFDYCCGFSISWLIMGILDIILREIIIWNSSISFKFLFLITYTIAMAFGCIRNHIILIKYVKNF